jgi:hypothetical protein
MQCLQSMCRDLSSKGIGQEGKKAGFRLWKVHSMFLLSGSLSGGGHFNSARMGLEVGEASMTNDH